MPASASVSALLAASLLLLCAGLSNAIDTERCDGTIVCGRIEMNTHGMPGDPMPSHGGSGANLVLRYNKLAMPPAPETHIDVIVYLHGYSPVSGAPDDQTMTLHAESTCGMELNNRHDGRASLVIIPRGKKTGSVSYDFPDVFAAGGFDNLMNFGMAQLAAQPMFHGVTFVKSRVILGAHSGGGHAQMEILRTNKATIHEVFVFDATYWGSSPLSSWVKFRTDADKAALAGLSTPQDKENYMTTQGGACRVIYRPNTKTQAQALAVSHLPASTHELFPYYRLHSTSVGHPAIPGRFGPQLLADAKANLT